MKQPPLHKELLTENRYAILKVIRSITLSNNLNFILHNYGYLPD